MKKDGHYRLPLKIINSYIWSGLTKIEQAILTVIGAYINGKNRACSLTRSEIAQRIGYSQTNLRLIDNAIRVLVAKYLITISKRKGQSSKYYLTDLSQYEERKSYFPLYRYQIRGLYWAKLKPCEKAVYPVLYVKGVINQPDIKNIPEIYCRGQIKNKKDFCKWTGLCYESLKRALRGLEEKSLLVIDSDGNYDLYRLEVMKIKG